MFAPVAQMILSLVEVRDIDTYSSLLESLPDEYS
jgi:hypothetical protein